MYQHGRRVSAIQTNSQRCPSTCGCDVGYGIFVAGLGRSEAFFPFNCSMRVFVDVLGLWMPVVLSCFCTELLSRRVLIIR